MSKWTYELDIKSDIWTGCICVSRKEAIKVGRDLAIEEGKSNFKIAKLEEATNFRIDVDYVIEDIKNAAYEEGGEAAEDYLDDVSRAELIELEEELNIVFAKWQEKYKHKPDFYKIIREETIEIEQ